MKFSEVDGVLAIAHHGPEGDLHGHTYKVSARFRFERDARDLKAALTAVLRKYDHKLVPDDLQLGENLAEAIGEQLPGCFMVRLARDLEGFHAIWIADDFAQAMMVLP
jgi:6-pyruvoyl-tetrahydropterin synthase